MVSSMLEITQRTLGLDVAVPTSTRPKMPKNLARLPGAVFGSITVIKYLGDDDWMCRCVCGRLVLRRSVTLVAMRKLTRAKKSSEIRSCRECTEGEPMPTVPINPQSDRVLRNRFHQALDELFLVDEFRQGGDRPGRHAENAFDFEDGMRLVVSREYDPIDKSHVIHFSCSAEDQSIFADRMRQIARERGNDPMVKAWKRAAVIRFQELSGWPGAVMNKVRLIGSSDTGIFHWSVGVGVAIGFMECEFNSRGDAIRAGLAQPASPED